MPFFYNVKNDSELFAKVEADQLGFLPVATELDDVHYYMDSHLRENVLISTNTPDGYKQVRVGLVTFEVLDDTTYFNVYQEIGGKVSIVPSTKVELTDTQFDDSDDEVSIARTLQGALFGLTIEGLDIQFDPMNAFNILTDDGSNVTTFSFGMSMAVKDEGETPIPVDIIGYGTSIGRVTLAEIIEDPETYDKASLQYATMAV